MYGWYKLVNETVDEMKIAYSFGRNKTCDGLMTYDKSADKITINKCSIDADDWLSKWLARHILTKIISGEISGERKMIAIG